MRQKLSHLVKTRAALISVAAVILLLIMSVLGGGLEALGRLGASPMTDHAQILFNPDDVFEIDWQVGSTHQELKRDQVGGEWQTPGSPINHEQIQKLLIGLAMASTDAHSFAPFNKVRGRLKMKSGESVAFKWNGSVFKWTAGPQAETGGLPNVLLRHVLESGAYFSEKPKVGWCQSRPTEIRVQSDSMNFVLHAGEQGSWLRSSPGEPEHKIDPTAVEKWLAANCEFDGLFWRDLAVAERVATASTFSFVLKDGTHQSWDFDSKSGVVKVAADRSIIAPDFILALGAVAKIP